MKFFTKFTSTNLFSIFLILIFVAPLYSQEKGLKELPLNSQVKKIEKKSDENSILDMLKEGNKNFVSGSISKQNVKEQRNETAKGQKPFIIVVACSDSRVPPELIFDKGIGKIFVIRTAGNVLDSVALGSIEYAAEHLHAKALLILGHSSCGAVNAALQGETNSPYINSILRKIFPAVKKCKKEVHGKDELAPEVIKENVNNQIRYAMKSEIVKELVEKNELEVFGAVYNIATGKVEFMKVSEEKD